MALHRLGQQRISMRSLARAGNGEAWLREATAKVGNVLQWHSLGSPGLATAKHGKRRIAKAMHGIAQICCGKDKLN